MEDLKSTTYLKTAIKKVKDNFFLIIPVLIFSLLFLPHTASLPYLDGNIDFIQTILYHKGGFPLYFKIFSSVHPPLKIYVFDIFYSFFGIHEFILTSVSYLLGLAGITCFYFLLKKFASGSEKIGSILFSICPLYISVGIFGLTDYILTNLILFTLLMLILNKKLLLLISLICVVLVKETGLLIPGVLLGIEIFIFIFKKNIKHLKYIIFYFIPFFIYYMWFLYISRNGIPMWNDWIFTDTADKGTFYTIISNVLSLKVFNEYASQHFLQLLFLNFNWIMIIISLFLTFTILKNEKMRAKLVRSIVTFDARSRAILFIILFCFSYSLTVLTLQTYTIPRYALPLFPFLILWFSVIVSRIKNYYIKTVSIFLVFAFTIIGLFFSIDPVAYFFWGKIDVFGQKFYATNYYLSGNDGLTYNYQYLLIAKKRSDIIREEKYIPITYCPYIFPDPKNDFLTLNVLHIKSNRLATFCKINPSVQ